LISNYKNLKRTKENYMKKGMSLGLLLFLWVFNLSTWGMAPEEDDVTKVTRLLREVEERVNGNYEEGTLFLGNTDGGKSTLFNYLQGAILHGKFKSFGEYEIILDPSVDVARYSAIGSQSTVSQTTIPVVIDNSFDCPGFQDTRPFQDIVNAYSIYRVVNQTKKLKILLISSFEELFDAKAVLFMTLLDQIGEIFQHNIDALCKGLCLVVTKTNRDQVNKAEYQDLFSKMLGEQLGAGFSQKNPRIKILRFLSQTNRIAFFKMPKQEGPILDDDKNAIRAMLATVSSQGNTKQADIKPMLSISDKSKLSLEILLSGMLEKMRETFTDLSSSYPELYARFINAHLDQNAGQLRRIFGEVTRHLQGVSDEPERFYESAKNVSDILKLLSHKDRESFGDSVVRLTFFATAGLGDAINREVEKFRIFSHLRNLIKSAKRYVADPKIKYRRNIAKITGGLLGTSDIPEEILRRPDLSEIELYSWHTLLIDEDLTAPGVNLTLIAPHWWVIGNKKISLKGAEALAHNNPKARDGDDESSHGEDGLPGKPGGSGSHFYGKGEVFEGLENLTIDVSGGKGGPGQNGGNGAKGQDGLPGNILDVEHRKAENRKTEFLIEGIYALQLMMPGAPSGAFETYESGIPAKEGGSGGKGGARGTGGIPGSVTLKDKENKDVLIRKDESIGDSDDFGIAGDPGEGGEHKPVYAGTYIDIQAFGFYMDWNKRAIERALGPREDRTYGLRARLTQRLFGLRGCQSLVQHAITGGVFTIGLLIEVGKTYVFYQLGGPVALAAGLALPTIPLGLDKWYEKPHAKNLGAKAPDGNRPADLNENGRELALPKEPIDFAEKNEHFQRLLQKNRS
jgi:hypothetical protein